MKPDITVAIATFNREVELISTISDILGQSHENLELLVLDQSKQHSPVFEEGLNKIADKRFRYIRLSPPSLMAARNYALKIAKAPIILFLDDDIQAGNNLVAEHLESFAKHPEISAVAGRVTQDGFPKDGPILHFEEYAISVGVFSSKKSGYTNAFPGGNHSIRVADALKVGGYDTRYYRTAFREENDISMRMVKLGMKIFYNPKALVHHLNASSGGHAHYTDLFDSPDFYRNEIFFTMHVLNFKKIPKSLYIKFMTYCHIRPLDKGLKRSWYFLVGMLVAVRRLVFARQIVSREVKS